MVLYFAEFYTIRISQKISIILPTFHIVTYKKSINNKARFLKKYKQNLQLCLQMLL